MSNSSHNILPNHLQYTTHFSFLKLISTRLYSKINQTMQSKNSLEGRRRSQSLCSLQSDDYVPVCKKFGRTYSDSSVEVYGHSDEDKYDSGIGDKMFDGDTLLGLEHKIDRLNDLFLEQCRLLTTMKEEIRGSKLLIEKTEQTHNQLLIDMLKKANERVEDLDPNQEGPETINSRAKVLLSAIEKRNVSVDSEIRATLMAFLQSEELRERMVRATADSVRDMIGNSFSDNMAKLYLPVLERSYRRLVVHIHHVVEQAFVELEAKSSSLYKSVYKTSGALRRALNRHQSLLEATANPDKNLASTLQCTVEELLHNELKEWRQKVFDLFTEHSTPESEVTLESAPLTPPQPADPEVSVIDQLMRTAIINKAIKDGDFNDCFERALCASDLSLVMAACRAADPEQVFAAPCRLQQHVLLSLVQQLATDMVHETHLKCRYLEEAIIILNSASADIRVHLPLVVGEVRNYLSSFVKSYPNHVANKRITLIIMAANNLLK